MSVYTIMQILGQTLASLPVRITLKAPEENTMARKPTKPKPTWPGGKKGGKGC